MPSADATTESHRRRGCKLGGGLIPIANLAADGNEQSEHTSARTCPRFAAGGSLPFGHELRAEWLPWRGCSAGGGARPAARTSPLPPQSADKSAHSKASGENDPCHPP